MVVAVAVAVVVAAAATVVDNTENVVAVVAVVAVTVVVVGRVGRIEGLPDAEHIHLACKPRSCRWESKKGQSPAKRVSCCSWRFAELQEWLSLGSRNGSSDLLPVPMGRIGCIFGSAVVAEPKSTTVAATVPAVDIPKIAAVGA